MRPPEGMTFTNITTADDLANNLSRWRVEQQTFVHAAPPKGSGLTPCCERTPFDLPLLDRLTLDGSLVTCPRRPWASGGH